MKNIEILESNYPISRINYNAFQFKFPLDFFTEVPVDDPVTSFVKIMKGIDTHKYFKNVPHRGNQGYDPHMMLNVVLFAFMKKVPSLRELEDLCRYDIRYMWLSDNETPSFMAFQRFIASLDDSIEDIFHDICKRLIELENIDTSVLYIDGTKIEANAKKNSFVWKKSIITNRDKMFIKISRCISLINNHFNRNYKIDDKYHSTYIGTIADDIMAMMADKSIPIIYGAGHRQSTEQKLYDEILGYFIRLLKYEESLKICGERNSYSKTDHDATMMNMKYDYYNKTGVFKPGYNLQIGVSDEYIMHYKLYPNPTDTKTFIPFMESYKQAYGYYPRWPIADAGYGSYDNYMYCIINKLELGMKYNYYSKKNETSFRKKIFHSMNFKTNEDGYKVCPQGHPFNIHISDNYNDKSKYLQITQSYSCGKCENCSLKEKCTTSAKGRILRYNPLLEEMQKKVDENLSTDMGKEMKKQRSIQAEGTFGVIKQDAGYDRLRRRGKGNAKIEIGLMLIGFNLRKYHNKKQRKEIQQIS